MTSPAAPRFDESLADAARGLHLGELTFVAFVATLGLFVLLERRWRPRWALVPSVTFWTQSAPYRASSMVSEHLERAPASVRAAAFVCLAFGLLFTPLIVLALVKYPFDGVAIPLVPGLALVAVNWACAWLLLARSSLASAMVKSGAVGSLMANVGLLGIAGAHFVVVELQRRDGIEHACSSSVTFVVIVFAVSSVFQSLTMMSALKSHQPLLDWSAARGRVGAASPAHAVQYEPRERARVDGLGQAEDLAVAVRGDEPDVDDVAASHDERHLAHP